MLLLVVASTAHAGGIPGMGSDVIIVTANALVGRAEAASEGTVTSEQLQNRPILRPGEVLEVIPGLIVTQHSGDGKANQYFLRGFNLDHGTDFATSVDDVPVNMPTHAHGQGYSDLNFLIPELVDRVEYKKGTYFAEEGNFSAAGAANLNYKRKLDTPLELSLAGGEGGYQRAFGAGSTAFLGGNLLIGGELSKNDGPWQLAEDYRKTSGLIKYTRDLAEGGFSLTASGYDGRWRSTDQIPLRAVLDGTIGRFGNIDPTDGGRTHRYTLSADAWRPLGAGEVRANVYAVDYKLDLISNFTYALDQVNGDQFEQFDDRHIYGGHANYKQPLSILGHDGTFQSGVQIRYDDIGTVGLYRTKNRARFATVREDSVTQGSYSAYASQAVQWTSWFRSTLGVRYDDFQFDIHSNLAANSGSADDSIVSPKLALVFGPWSKTEYFFDIGRGFHSNDARGTTITVAPSDGVTPVDKVDPLVEAIGAEIGFRTAIIPNVQLSGSLWTLKLDSELLFVGDGGTTEPSRATKRYGVELGAYYTPMDHILIDADLAWSHARFTEFDPAGDPIPNAVETVASIGATYNSDTGFYGGARLRFFSSAPLIEDDSVRSKSTSVVNLDSGYHINKNLSLTVSVFNVFDSDDNDITYFYQSQLAGEAAPVDDIHFHPVEPRTVRAAVNWRF